MHKLETGAFMYKYSKGLLPDGFNNFLLQGLKYMIIPLGMKIIIIKLETLELVQITQLELMVQYF